MNNQEEYISRSIEFTKQGMDISSACEYSRAIDLLGEDIFKDLDETDKKEVINFAEICQNYIQLCSYN